MRRSKAARPRATRQGSDRVCCRFDFEPPAKPGGFSFLRPRRKTSVEKTRPKAGSTGADETDTVSPAETEKTVAAAGVYTLRRTA
jgi:hypothetical protein